MIAATLLTVLKPITAPVALALLAHAWAIPELHAARGAAVLRPEKRADDGPERRALLLLGDLVNQPARTLHGATGLVLERGELGTWIVGEAGAVLVAPGGHRVYCYCVKAIGNDLPAPDRIAHLLLALRCDERDFATVANLAFSGAPWRLRRRLPAGQRDGARRGADRVRTVAAALSASDAGGAQHPPRGPWPPAGRRRSGGAADSPSCGRWGC